MKIIKSVHVLIFVSIAAVAVIFLFLGSGKKNNFNPPRQNNMKITSIDFENNGFIPKKYTCQGKDINPPLVFVDVPKEAKSLALIVDDPDAPMGTWTHWTIWNIKPDVRGIIENSIPESAVTGMNSSGRNGYQGPCPPSGTHRYFFKLYALDKDIDLKPSASKADLEKAISDHIIGYGELVGVYKK